jgi:hypothetical protein
LWTAKAEALALLLALALPLLLALLVGCWFIAGARWRRFRWRWL